MWGPTHFLLLNFRDGRIDAIRSVVRSTLQSYIICVDEVKSFSHLLDPRKQ